MERLNFFELFNFDRPRRKRFGTVRILDGALLIQEAGNPHSFKMDLRGNYGARYRELLRLSRKTWCSDEILADLVKALEVVERTERRAGK